MRELVVLRLMEKIRCESRGEKNVYVPWQPGFYLRFVWNEEARLLIPGSLIATHH